MMENKTKDLEKIVKQNGAFSNILFDISRNSRFNVNYVNLLLANFQSISKYFALGSFAYCNEVASHIIKNDETNIPINNIENFLAKVIKITSEEFQLNGSFEPNNFHYNLLSRLYVKIANEEIREGFKSQPDLIKETHDICEQLITNFKDPNLLSGLANIFVVEYSALNIIHFLDNLLSNTYDNEGNKISFSSYELEHISTHKVLEIEHDKDAHLLINLVANTPENYIFLSKKVDQISRLFGGFWSKLHLDLELYSR